MSTEADFKESWFSLKQSSMCFLLPLSMAVILLGLLVTLGFHGWPGETGQSAAQFCEAHSIGNIKQQANTWSSLGFVIAGLAIGWQAWCDVEESKQKGFENPLVSTVAFSASYASCIVVIGAGSVAMHASTTQWGAAVDVFGMHLWAAWCGAYATMRYMQGGPRVFLVVISLAIAVVTVLTILDKELLGASDISFASFIFIAVGIEVVSLRSDRSRIVDWQYLLWAVMFFLTGFAIWVPSRSGGALCRTDWYLQGHAVWHLFCATSVFFVYLYGRSERAQRDPKLVRLSTAESFLNPSSVV